MKKRILIGVVIAVSILLPTLVLLQGWAWELAMKNNGEMIVQKIELYRQEHGRLPESLTDVGVQASESGPFYYDKTIDGQSYMVSFGITLGESITYRSDTGKWE